MHFFRRSKIHLDCFTARRDVIEYSPVVNGIEVIPHWWKALPKNKIHPGNGFSPSPTMKTCIGMYDYYANSIAIPLWSELAINILPDGTFRWQYADRVSTAESHPHTQYTGFLPNERYGHLKLTSGWLFHAKDNVNWLETEPIYGRNEITNYSVAQGLLNFSKQLSVNIQLFFNTSRERTFTIPHGSPFFLTPLSDKEVVVHRQLITQEKFDSLHQKGSPITFINKYRAQQKVIKCPYKDNIK